MGLDLYTGPLTRYHLGDWLTVTQRTAVEHGAELWLVHPDGARADASDPPMVERAVLEWQLQLGEALGVAATWPEGAELAYATDKPDWAGFGAVQLLAAYDERPALRPRRRVLRPSRGDDPRAFVAAAAHRAAAAEPAEARYPALLLGAEWWLPAELGAGVVEAPNPAGVRLRMAGVDQLYEELVELNSRTLRLSPRQLDEAREGRPERCTVEALAPFGLSTMLALTEFAVANRQPLLLDY